MSSREEKRLRNKIHKALLTDDAMVQRGGDWKKVVLPAAVLQ